MFQVACFFLVFFWLKTVALSLVCSFPFVVSVAAAPAAWPDNGPVVEKKGGGERRRKIFCCGGVFTNRLANLCEISPPLSFTV